LVGFAARGVLAGTLSRMARALKNANFQRYRGGARSKKGGGLWTGVHLGIFGLFASLFGAHWKIGIFNADGGAFW